MNNLIGNFKAKFLIVLGLILALSVATVFGTPQAQAAPGNDLQAKKEAERLALAFYEASTYDKETNKYSFDVDKAIASGISMADAVQMKNYLESLSPEEAKDTHDQQISAIKEVKSNITILPLIWWAVKILAGAGLAWLGKKLLDMGAYEFCKRYKDYNDTTRYVCKFIG
ncbi:hypothetical protein [Bacillus atrophaeus]|uniref:hypothetical protein n=1 Tax=Bacillus atrophaeus TaxID=1452 RepID=UPI0022817A88|nr:hypothetical protein [Bacillus atrophaeus]MCY8813693.1 hypothetical protein [Bacillus atrophaeus]MCY8820234.1 hypothetical protein [Bacillus atrophaeus]MCY8828642.1 hypothetical protein [Bacillus atrophaeus]MCY8832729.1 hypothetical protein [Bacillus atrophaeus]MEC0749737.1 hypothetical protein [Bacillus atrophaeus]